MENYFEMYYPGDDNESPMLVAYWLSGKHFFRGICENNKGKNVLRHLKRISSEEYMNAYASYRDELLDGSVMFSY